MIKYFWVVILYRVGLSNLRECTATGLSGGGVRHRNDREGGMLVVSLGECQLQIFCLTYGFRAESQCFNL